MSLLNAFVYESYKQIDELIATKSRQLLEGFSQDYPSYKECVGELRSLSRVRQIFEESLSKVNSEE